MIKIIAKHTVLNAKVDAFKALAKEIISATREEKGCISYELFEDTTNSNILTFIEEWQDMEAIKSHFNSDHFTRIVPQMKSLLSEDPALNLYQNTKL